MSRQRLVCVLLVTALLASCSKKGNQPVPSLVEPTASVAADNAARVAGFLPAETIAYFRLRDAGTLAQRAVQPGLITDAQPVQQQLTQAYAGLLVAVGQQNPFGLAPEVVKEVADNLNSVHVAVIAADNHIQEPTVFLEMANPAIAGKVRKKLAERAAEKDLQGVKVLDLTTLPGSPARTLHVLDETVLVVGPDAALAKVIAARSGRQQGSLAATAAFRKVEADLGRTGDLFGYFSVAELRAAMLREIDAGPSPRVSPAEEQEFSRQQSQRRREEIENLPFKTIGHVGVAAGVDGSLTVRAYTAPGKKLPDFLVRRPAEKALFRHIPADAVLAYGLTYEGGKHTRKSFVEWLKEETKANGTPLVPPQMARVLTQEFDRLEADVVVIAQDLWAAILPVKTELAFAVAPDATGRCGGLMVFDIEDRAQADKLRQQIFEAGKRHELPWKETTHEGLTIRYLDLEEMLRKDGATPPRELLDQVQLKVGFAQTDKLFLVGTVEAIKFAHRPTGPVLADTIRRDHIDPANALHLTLQPGRFLHGPTRIPAPEKLLALCRRHIPKDASWSITVSLEEEQATLRSNIPLVALAAWIGTDLSELGQAFR
jgi:hypothetical protein